MKPVYNTLIMGILLLFFFGFFLIDNLYSAALGNTPSTARQKNIGEEVDGHIGEENTQDWYKVTVADFGRLTVTARGNRDVSSFAYLELYTPLGESLRWVNMSGLSAHSLSYDVGPGTYFIRIIQRFNNVFSYDLTTRFSPAEYENDPEPNDNMNQAVTIDLGEDVTGNIGYYADYNNDGRYSVDTQDWYKVTIADLGRLTVTARGNRDISSFAYLELYNPLGENLRWGNMSGLSAHSLSYDVGPGTYFIRIIQRSNNVFSYDLTTRFSPAEYENDPEPNDNMNQASEIPFGQNTTGNIGYYADHNNDGGYSVDTQDWWKISLVEPGQLTVTARGNRDVSSFAYLYLYNPLGESLRWVSMTGLSAHSISYDIEEPGTYYVRIEQRSNHVFSYVLSYVFSNGVADSYNVITASTEGGSISPQRVQVLHGETQTFNVITDDGFVIDSVTGCGGSLDGDAYTTGPVTEACTVEATFLYTGHVEPLERFILSGIEQSVDITSDLSIIGTGASETLNIFSNLNVDFTAGDDDRINLPYELEHYEITSMGNHLFFSDAAANKVVTIIVTGTSTVGFADGSTATLEMVFLPGGPPQIQLGGAIVGTTVLDHDLVELCHDSGC